jgi:potassium-transporting ATPase potassium-binding subunit
MPSAVLFQIPVFLVFITIIAFFLGEYMAKVYAGERTFISKILIPVENGIYKILKTDPHEDMSWKTFASNFVIFIFIGISVLFFICLAQNIFPLNPEHFPAFKWHTAINTAIAFVTNSDWQAYNIEGSLSYFTRLFGLGIQNFLSAALGMTIAVSLMNAFIKKSSTGLGNFWVYLTRSILYILLPLSIILAVFLIAQGTPDNLNAYVHAETLEGKEQIIAQGPAASQIAIKQIGTNGGGFFTANSAHPYENPTPFTDLISILALLAIAAAFPITFGVLIKDRIQGWAIFATMMLLFITGLVFILWTESGNSFLTNLGIQNGLNMEGKEVRFGIQASVAYANSATATSGGAANSSYTSLMPLSGLILIFNMAIGEAIFGGAGSGFINMMFYIILTMFLVGLMIGRSPEIYGKKLDSREMLLTVIALFIPNVLQLVFSAVALSIPANISGLLNPQFHGISEIFYNYTSAIGNNGSAFGGINMDTKFYNLSIALTMLIGFLTKYISALAIAGSIISKKSSPPITRFPTTGPIFNIVLIMVILFVGTLTFLPVLVLGPILEHLSFITGNTF